MPVAGVWIINNDRKVFWFLGEPSRGVVLNVPFLGMSDGHRGWDGQHLPACPGTGARLLPSIKASQVTVTCL